ncbi:MAG: 4Fe-4S binding protein [Candidatus Omnitrophota bacterium]
MEKKKGWKDIPIGGLILNAPTSLAYKTGTWRSFRPVWNSEKCIHCMQCWYVCPDFAVKTQDGKITGFDYEYCKGCGLCANTCPVKPEKAITMITEQEAKKKEKA